MHYTQGRAEAPRIKLGDKRGRAVFALVCGVSLGSAVFATADGKLTFVDLQSKGNQRLSADLH